MATLAATRIEVTAIAGASGAARIKIYTGTLPNQSILADMELTAAQNAAMQTALAAAATTVTNFDFVAGESPLVGVYQVA
jgi:hypothetical protein